MEENMFYNFLIEYENICQELMQINFIDRSIEIDKLEQIIQRQEQFLQYCKETAEKTCKTEGEKDRLLKEQTDLSTKMIIEAKKRKKKIIERQAKKKQKRQEVETRLGEIRQKAEGEKERRIAEKEKIFCIAYSNYQEQELELEEQLNCVGDITIDVTEETFELIIELKRIRNERKEIEEQYHRSMEEIKANYKKFLEQIALMEEKIRSKILRQQRYEEKERRKGGQYEEESFRSLSKINKDFLMLNDLYFEDKIKHNEEDVR